MNAWLRNEVASTPLVALRVAFGLVMFISTLRFVAMGWVDEYYIQPDFHFTYWGFGWVEPLPGVWLYLVYAAIGLFSLCIAAGAFYRFSSIGFFLLFTYSELLDKTYYLNHYYFVSVLSFLLIFLPLHRWASIDAWLRPQMTSPVVSQWSIAAVRLQIALVYFFAGIAKLQTDWIVHALPLKLWLNASADLPLIGWLFGYEWTAFGMSWGGAIFDLTIPFVLLHRRTRPLGYLAVISFHTMTGLLFPIGMFPLIMTGCALVFFSAEDFARLGRWLKVPVRDPQSLAQPIQPLAAARLNPVVIVTLSIFFAIQFCLPLRHWLYPGNLLWTEEGFRYAWHVMVAHKTGFVIFHAKDGESGREFPLFPGDYLTDNQEQQMSFQPDMILEFAHHLQRELQKEGMTEISIRAEAYASLNGRPSQLLIDPTVDLTKEKNTPWPKRWILPLANDSPLYAGQVYRNRLP